MEIQGKLVEKYETTQISDSFRKREFVIEFMIEFVIAHAEWTYQS